MMNRNEIIITDSDIDQIENAMGNQVHFDSVRRDIIKNLRPDKIQDIQVLVQIFLADLILIYWVPRNEGLRA